MYYLSLHNGVFLSDDDDIHFLLDQHLYLDSYRAS